MRSITVDGITWDVHSPSLFVHEHHSGAQILCGCNGRTWQLGINDVYRDRQFFTRDQAMQAYADGVHKACQLAEQWNGQ